MKRDEVLGVAEVKMKSVRVCSARTIDIHLVVSDLSLFIFPSLFILALFISLQGWEHVFICFVLLFLVFVGEVAGFAVA